MTRQRRWALGGGFAAGTALLVAAAYAFAMVKTWPCPPGPCDPPAPSHLHLRLSLVLAAMGCLVLFATALVAVVWKVNE